MVQLWFSCGSAVVQLWFSCGSAVVQLWFSYGSAMVSPSCIDCDNKTHSWAAKIENEMNEELHLSLLNKYNTSLEKNMLEYKP